MRRTLTSQVIEHVLSLIKTRKVKAEKLSQLKSGLPRSLVSVAFVWAVLKSLEFLGLVTIRPRIGAVVQGSSSGVA